MLVPIYHRGLLIMGHLPLPSRTCFTPLLPDITITTTPNNMSPPTSPPSPAQNTHTTQEQAQDTCSVQNHIIIVHSLFFFVFFLYYRIQSTMHTVLSAHILSAQNVLRVNQIHDIHRASKFTVHMTVCLQFCHFWMLCGCDCPVYCYTVLHALHML